MQKEINHDGYCLCGCGGRTKLATRTHGSRGHLKGAPQRYILGHYNKNRMGNKSSSWKGGRFIARNGYVYKYAPDHPNKTKLGYVMEHRMIVESVIDGLLADTVDVHHVDGNRSNNNKSNLVACENRAYHMVLHQRDRAYKNCGNAGWLKCGYCGKYSPKQDLYIHSGGTCGYHRSCSSAYNKKRILSRRRSTND